MVIYGYTLNKTKENTMEYLTIFQQIRKEGFNETVAISAIQILTLNMGMKPSEKDFKEPGRFEERLRKKSRDVLWELSDTEFNLIWIIYKVRGFYDV